MAPRETRGSPGNHIAGVRVNPENGRMVPREPGRVPQNLENQFFLIKTYTYIEKKRWFSGSLWVYGSLVFLAFCVYVYIPPENPGTENHVL